MQFPYTPKAVFNKMGGRIMEITGVGHKTDKPQDGYSRDYWFYIGRVKWDDTGKTGAEGHIEPGAMCADTQEGFDEINTLSEALMAYLRERGEWFRAGKSKHEGWYAHRKNRVTA